MAFRADPAYIVDAVGRECLDDLVLGPLAVHLKDVYPAKAESIEQIADSDALDADRFRGRDMEGVTAYVLVGEVEGSPP